MKRPIALFASLFAILILSATLGIARANPKTSDTTEATATPTATATATATETATTTSTSTSTATTDPCSARPPAPNPVAPDNGATVNKVQIKLRWTRVDCVKTYQIIIRRGAKNGPVQDRRTSHKLKTVTDPLSRGYWYYWVVKACVPDHGCTRSKARAFRIPAANTPIPQTPNPTGQATTQPGGTPVPGSPPGNLVNYYSPDRGGPGVYLNNESSALYRYDCGKDQNLWGHYPTGSTIFNIALWYYPNETITYRRMDFNQGQIVETKTVSANGSGYLSYDVNTSSWTANHHYHLLFRGQSSGVEYCGHFDIQTVGNGPGMEPVPHSDADVERVYRAAGVDRSR